MPNYKLKAYQDIQKNTYDEPNFRMLTAQKFGVFGIKKCVLKSVQLFLGYFGYL